MVYIKTNLQLPKEIRAVQQGRHISGPVPVMNPGAIGAQVVDERGNPLPPEAHEGPSGADKYQDPEVAESYDAKRENTVKHQEEQVIIEEWLSELPQGNWVMDCPVGTGRFIPFYHEHGLLCRAVDKSRAMLEKAAAKVAEGQHISFNEGNVLDLAGAGFMENSVDAAIMIRLTRWLSPEQCVQAYAQLMRVARKQVIITMRVTEGHPHVRGYDLVEAALHNSGWQIGRNLGIPSDQGYRIVEFVPCG